MAKRTWGALADLVEDMVDKARADTTFDTFVQAMLSVTLQEIITEVPYARWLYEEHSITLTASQQHVTLPSDLDIDTIVSMRDNTNNRRVIRITAEMADRIDPGRDQSGNVFLWWFQRVGGADRLYFYPTPDATDSLTLIAGELITDPAAGASSALPAKYESTLIYGTLVKVWERLDPDHNATKWERLYANGLNRIKYDANSSPGDGVMFASHRPLRTDVGVVGPSFPTNFDITP